MAESVVTPISTHGTSIAEFDADLWAAMENENRRQEEHVELIASENYTSPLVMEAQGSQLTNKYAEGYPGKRYYGGCEYVDQVEVLAIERVKALFGADYANVQHSGSQANAAVFLALLSGGDTILGMSLDAGGHLTHGAAPNFSGKLYNSVQYGLNPDTGEVDYDEVQRLATEHQPKMVIAGFSAYSRQLDWARFREIADSVGAYLMVDMAHVARTWSLQPRTRPLRARVEESFWLDLMRRFTRNSIRRCFPVPRVARLCMSLRARPFALKKPCRMSFVPIKNAL